MKGLAIHVREFHDTNKEKIAELIEWLSSFGKTTNEGVTRLLYSKAWCEAQSALKNKMKAIGLDAYFDCVGNLFGRLQGTDEDNAVILTGSHIDTVIDGGKYDGAYGIVASLLAVSRLYASYGKPKKTIEVVSFCEEEGSRFPLTFWGSRNITGMYDIGHTRGLVDANGVPFMDAMKEAGFETEKYIQPIRSDIARFIEVHIEQGMVLERNQNAVGIVTHIVGQRRYNIRIKGESNHAGTTPMNLRRDAVVTASKLISFLTKKAESIDSQLVATVGRIEAQPNVPNVVAGEVEFSLDIRHHKQHVLDEYCMSVFSYFEEVAKSNDLIIDWKQWMNVEPVAMDAMMHSKIKTLAEQKQISFQDIVSGAGHDAQVFASTLPTNLIFVPSKGGISHNPQEFTSSEDLEVGVKLLTDILYQLAYE